MKIMFFDDFRRWFDNSLEQDVATLLERPAQYEQLPIKSQEKSKFQYSGTLSGGSIVDQKLRFDAENAHQDAHQTGVEKPNVFH